jgi:hypothetical protein
MFIYIILYKRIYQIYFIILQVVDSKHFKTKLTKEIFIIHFLNLYQFNQVFMVQLQLVDFIQLSYSELAKLINQKPLIFQQLLLLEQLIYLIFI